MGFVAICTALYDYQPQSEGELELKEGELLYITEKSTEDDWWRAKKKATDDEEEEPEGLIPNNYVENARPAHQARALYDYTRQTEEEVSFSEDAPLEVYDTSDDDWTLVGVDGDYGFAPANYIEILGSGSKTASAPVLTTATAVSLPPRPDPEQESVPPASPSRGPQSAAAANLARVLGNAAPTSPVASRALASPPLPQRQITPNLHEDAVPSLPRRPPSLVVTKPHKADELDDEDEDSPRGVMASPPIRSPANFSGNDEAPLRSPGGFHLYNISEMVSAMGRRKKIPITLGLNVATGTLMLSPSKSRDGPTQEWSADKLEHYSIEGKHVFLELNRPSKSLDLHAGAKDTAEEIVVALGEIAGAHRATGLKEVITAASNAGIQKKGVVLYDFMAQGDDEVTVAEGDEVVVLDDTKSEEWWNIRRVKNGKEGVVPSSYVEITGTIAIEPASRTGINAGRSTVEQNRLEEERLAKEAAQAHRSQENKRLDTAIPDRASSLGEDERRSSKKDKKVKSEKARSKPDPSRVRTWTDHSGSFKVDAQFIGVADGKIHLHKVNGVKIAVPVAKMSPPDLAYVEKVTKESIDDMIPVADLIKMKREHEARQGGRNGASVEPVKQERPRGPEYDWFDFFLQAGVGLHQCERYAQAMVKDSMEEDILPDITMDTLRTLGLKEGDALKVMKYIDRKLGRSRAESLSEQPTGSIFTGPGGAIKDNSRKRPEANRTVGDAVDPKAFADHAIETKTSAQVPAPLQPHRNGFEDEAWPRSPAQANVAASMSAARPTASSLSANMQALSLLDQPLVPTPAPTRAISQTSAASTMSTPVPPSAPAGATPQFFQRIDQAQQPNQPLQPQQSGLGPLPQIGVARQRPQAPQQNYAATGLLLPPPRPASAPQHAQQLGLQPLQPQLTGLPTTARPAQPGQSLDELTSQRMQQYAQLQAQQTGFQQQPYLPHGLQSQMPVYPQQQLGQMPQPYLNGNVAGSPFADPRSMAPQPTGFGPYPPPGGVNALLPPALTPQKTGFQPTAQSVQPNGFGQFSSGIQPQNTSFSQPMPPQQTGFSQVIQPQATAFGQTSGLGTFTPPPIPPVPMLNTPAPLVPQKTGPAPNVSFGAPAKKLMPQPTGRANLAKASKYRCVFLVMTIADPF